MISSERLLEVAREVFLELGIRATTAEVARRAGIAEGTLFHRFKSKEELFRAAMKFDPEEALAFIDRLPTLAGQADLGRTLRDFAEQFLRIGRVGVPVMMMSWSNPDGPMCSDRGARHGRVLGALAAFFAAESRAGRIGNRNPEVLARMLLGSLHQFCLSELFAPGRPGPLSIPQFASEVVDILLAAAGEALPVARAPAASAGRSKRRVASRGHRQ